MKRKCSRMETRSHPARGRWSFHFRFPRRLSLLIDHTPQGDVGVNHASQPRNDTRLESHPVRGRRKPHRLEVSIRLQELLHPARGRRMIQFTPFNQSSKGAGLHPARGHKQPPRFTAQFCAAKRGGCFSVKFRAVPDFFRNFSNCGSFHSFYIRIQTVSHWKFPQKSGRNFSVSGVFLCRIPCYNGNKPFQTCFSHIPLLFCPKEMIP